MDIVGLRGFLGEDWTSVQKHIADALHSDIDLLNITNNTILSHSGKQLRPLLALFFARLCSCEQKANEASLRYSAATELLHNATLLHDDVADGSDQRRGVPTIRSMMGPAVSVLVGDYWLVKAMSLILQSAETDVKAIRIFSKTLSDLAEGEMLQLQKAQNGDTDENDYIRIIYSKTASLFEAACVSAAVSVTDDESYIKATRDYAVALGLAFQIKDDILDYVGTESVGKPLGVDILEQKITMPLLGALNGVSEQEQIRIRGLVKDIVDHPEYKGEILTFVSEKGGVEYAMERLGEYVDQAVEALDVFEDCEAKRYLVELAAFTADRNN